MLFYGNKELQDETIGSIQFNLYDFEARFMDTRIPRFTSIDPLAEKYYSVSPYAYCLNNPIIFVDRDGKQPWPQMAKHAMGLDTYISSHQGAMKMVGEQARGAANSLLTLIAIPQAIISGPAGALSSDGKPPIWCTPIQINEDFDFELKHSWLDENLSWEDGKEVMKNTIGAFLFILPFSQAESGIVRAIENNVISTSITSSIDGVDKLASMPTNQNASERQKEVDKAPQNTSLVQIILVFI